MKESSSMVSRVGCVLAVILIVCFSCDCAAITKVADRDLSKPKPGYGLVMMWVDGNGPDFPPIRLTSDLVIFSGWEVTQDKTGQRFLIHPYNKYGLFIAWLPEGTYYSNNFNHIAPRVYTVMPAPLGSFDVKAGQLTDLGALVAFGNLANPKVYFWARSPNASESDPHIDNGVLGETVKAARNKGRLGWSASVATVVSLNAKLKTYALIQMNNPILTPEGRLVSSELLGQVAVRDREGQWSHLDTETTQPITVAYQDAEGNVIAGGSRTLRIKKANADEWENVVLPDYPGGTPLAFRALPNAGYLLGMFNPGGYIVFRSADFTQGNWEVFAEYATPFTEENKTHHLTIFPDALTLVDYQMMSTSNDTEMLLQTYNETTGAWDRLPFPYGKEEAVSRVTALPGGGLAVLGLPQSYNEEEKGQFYVVKDGVVHWETRSLPLYSEVLTFDAYTLQRPPRLAFGYSDDLVHKPFVLHKTRDGGLTWNEVGPTPAINSLPAQIIALPEPGHLLLLVNYRRLYHSGDDGKTWKLERSPLFRDDAFEWVPAASSESFSQKISL